MTWEEAGLISKYPQVTEELRKLASRNVSVPALQATKERMERLIETGKYVKEIENG
jgi:hypothetical protein